MERGPENSEADFELPRILFVHGRRPKPEPEPYRAQLWRCLLEGVHRADPRAAEVLTHQPDCFRLIYWSDLFYSGLWDIEQDLPGIERVLELKEPTPQDVAEAHLLQRRGRLWLYRFIDRFPGLMRRFADGWIESTVRDTRRYLFNEEGAAERVTQRVSTAIDEMVDGESPVILIGHSLGSVIAYDTLWTLSHEARHPAEIDLFLTLGSPIGTRFIREKLKGAKLSGKDRYPRGIEHWLNLAAVGDVAAIDPTVSDDFAEMLELGLLKSLRDNTRGLFNSFRTEEGANLHRSYGYLVMPACGRAIADAMARRETPAES